MALSCELDSEKSNQVVVKLPKLCLHPVRADARIVVLGGPSLQFSIIDQVLDSADSSFTIGSFRSEAEINVTVVMLCTTFPQGQATFMEYMLEKSLVVPGTLLLVVGFDTELSFIEITSYD